MGKLSISFEASTEEKNEMNAIMNFVMAINGVQHIEPIMQRYEAPQAAPIMASTTNEPDFSFTVGGKEELSPDEKSLQDFKNEEPVELTKEQEEQAKRDARNAARRERDKQKRLEAAKQAEADKEAETKNSEANTEALEHSLSEKEAEDTPEVSETVFEDETNEEQQVPTHEVSPVEAMQKHLSKLDKVGITNECRNLMLSKGHAGHKDTIKNKMKADGIAGLPSMSLEQLKEYCLWLVTLS